MVIQGISYPSDFEAKKNMIETGRRMDEKGYVIAAEGSMSVRVGPDSVWITAAGTVKGALTQENFIRVDMSGKQIPASKKTAIPDDLAIHLAVYAVNPELRGIIHAYPPGAAVLACSGKDVQCAAYSPAVKELGHISLAGGDVSSAAMAAGNVCRSEPGIITAGDGCFFWGETLTDAYYKLEALEFYVKVDSMLSGESGARAGADAAPPAYTRTPAYTPQPCAPQPAYPDASAMSGIDGLTPIIKPGEKLPAPDDKAPAASPSPPSPAPVREAAPAAAPYTPPSAPNGNTVSTRSRAMAGVVRRSLESMQ